MATISGADYLTIAQAYAEAYEQQVGIVSKFWTAVQALRCQPDIQNTLDLLGEFNTAYLIAKSRLEATTTFDAAVLKIQQHITSKSGLTATAWIQENVVDEGLAAGIPMAWAILSKTVGFNIDTVIDSTTESSSSSGSSNSSSSSS